MDTKEVEVVLEEDARNEVLKCLDKKDDGSMGLTKSGPSWSLSLQEQRKLICEYCYVWSVNTARLARDYKSRALENATLKAHNVGDKGKTQELEAQNEEEKEKRNDLEEQLGGLKAQLAARIIGFPFLVETPLPPPVQPIPFQTRKATEVPQCRVRLSCWPFY